MREEEKVHEIKVTRYKWPDEIRQERRKFWTRLGVVSLLVVSFVLGWGSKSLMGGSTTGTTGSSELDSLTAVYETLRDKWYFSSEMDDAANTLLENAINGMIELDGDPFTEYMSGEEAQELLNSINSSVTGIGVQFNNQAKLITRVYPGTPAQQAGIKAGDIIVKVDGQDISGFTSDELVSAITGDVGTQVTLTIRRDGQTQDITITRATFTAVAYGEVLNDNTGYLAMTSFGDQLATMSASYLEQFTQAGVKNLVIDLRDNGGGLLSAVQGLGQLFLPAGSTVYEEKLRSGEITTYTVPVGGQPYTFDQIVILINGNTASASEVLTLALKENLDNVTVLGTKSYGKGTVQVSEKVGTDGILKYTIAKWLSPNGESIHEVGIEPDVTQAEASIFSLTYPEADEDNTYNYDQVGDLVAYAQSGLSYLGYDVRTDGYFDQKTLDALKAYSASIGAETSQIDKTLVNNLLGSSVAKLYTAGYVNDVQLQAALKAVQ